MYDKIVFLDIDGVLNDAQYMADTTAVRRCEVVSGGIIKRKVTDEDVRNHLLSQINPEYLSNFNEVLNRFNLGIVLSSSWRIASFTRNALFDVGIDNYKDRLLGYTKVLSSTPRGNEIALWMKDNSFNGKFIILDDDPDMAHLMPHLFKTSWYDGGLNTANKNRLIGFCEKYFSLLTFCK